MQRNGFESRTGYSTAHREETASGAESEPDWCGVRVARSTPRSTPHSVGRVLLAAVLLGALWLGWVSAGSAYGAGTPHTTWHPTQASYYTLFGNRTSCGRTAGPSAWFVASLKPDTANCGRRITICHRTRCVQVTVQDRGAWRSDNRRWDLQPRVRDALHCSSLCNVRWSRGWAR